MTNNPDAMALRAKIRDRVSAIWERLWEGKSRFDGKQVAPWRRAESRLAAQERAHQDKAPPWRG